VHVTGVTPVSGAPASPPDELEDDEDPDPELLEDPEDPDAPELDEPELLEPEPELPEEPDVPTGPHAMQATPARQSPCRTASARNAMGFTLGMVELRPVVSSRNAASGTRPPATTTPVHERRYCTVAARVAPGACTVPPTRSRERDALALIDEGGVVVLEDGRADAPVAFDHAVHEGTVLGRAHHLLLHPRTGRRALASRRARALADDTHADLRARENSRRPRCLE
jgi:hypothetical protein